MKNRMTSAAVALAALVAGAADFAPKANDGKAIQAAIDAAHAAGGGRVVLEKGTYVSGTLDLKSHVELHVSEGTTILGHSDFNKYDDVDDPRIGKQPEKCTKVFISCMDAEDVAITGGGTIDGQGPMFYNTNVPPWSIRYEKPPTPRPRMLQFYKCRHVRFTDVTFKDSPGWTCWMRNCEDIEVSRLKIHGDLKMINNDGLHFDGCKRIRVGDSDFRTGDDSIVFRAITAPDGNLYDELGEDLVVSNCVLHSACQGVRLGCPSDGLIRNALFKNCAFLGRNGVQCGHPFRYLRLPNRGHNAMENIVFEDCTMDLSGYPIMFFVDQGIKLRSYGNTTFRNLRFKSAKPIMLQGTVDSPVENVRLEDVTGAVANGGPMILDCVKNISMDRVSVSVESESLTSSAIRRFIHNLFDLTESQERKGKAK